MVQKKLVTSWFGGTEMVFGDTEMVLGVQKWPNPVILKNGDGIFPLRAAQRRVKEIKIPCES